MAQQRLRLDLHREAKRRVRPGKAAAQLKARAAFRGAAVTAKPHLKGRYHRSCPCSGPGPGPGPGLAGAVEEGPRAPQTDPKPRRTGPGGRHPVHCLRARAHPEHVGDRLEPRTARRAGREQCAPEPERREREVDVRVHHRPGVLLHRQVAGTVAGNAPYARALAERMASPWIEAGQRRFGPARIRTTEAAGAAADREDQPRVPALPGMVRADKGARCLAVERDAVFLAIEARHRTSHPERDEAVRRRRLATERKRRARDRLLQRRPSRSRAPRVFATPRRIGVGGPIRSDLPCLAAPGGVGRRRVVLGANDPRSCRPLQPGRLQGDRRRRTCFPGGAPEIANRMTGHAGRETGTPRRGNAIAHRVDHLLRHRATEAQQPRVRDGPPVLDGADRG